jgi:hypothetical protein
VFSAFAKAILRLQKNIPLSVVAHKVPNLSHF